MIRLRPRGERLTAVEPYHFWADDRPAAPAAATIPAHLARNAIATAPRFTRTEPLYFCVLHSDNYVFSATYADPFFQQPDTLPTVEVRRSLA